MLRRRQRQRAGRTRRRSGGWHEPIPALLDAADPGAVLRHDLYEPPPLTTYTSGNVVLAGDAAHAMTPDLGQGACQALEDAVVLAKVIDSGDGLGAYDRQRRPRTQMIARRAHRIGVAAQWGISGGRGPPQHRAVAATSLIERPVPRPGPGLGRMNARPGRVTRSR